MALGSLGGLGLLGGVPAPQAPTAPSAPKVGFNNFDDYAKAFHQSRDGSLFGGGQEGINQRSYEMSGRGRAPFTVKGVMTAMGNAASLIKGPLSPGGLFGLAMTGTNTRPSGIFGNLFGGQVQDIPGQTPYDADLRQSILNGMPLSRADDEQVRRNADRQRAKFAAADTITARGQRGISAGGNAGGGYGGAPGGGFGRSAAGTTANGGDY